MGYCAEKPKTDKYKCFELKCPYRQYDNYCSYSKCVKPKTQTDNTKQLIWQKGE